MAERAMSAENVRMVLTFESLLFDVYVCVGERDGGSGLQMDGRCVCVIERPCTQGQGPELPMVHEIPRANKR